MIKAVLVEDELLVRKGLIMTLPWGKYGIEIVGEDGFNWLQEAERLETGSGCVLVLARDTDYPWLEECFLGEEQLSEWVLVKIRNIQSIPETLLPVLYGVISTTAFFIPVFLP